MTAGFHKSDIDPAALDPDGIAESQSITAPAAMVLNGALCVLGTALQFDIGDAYSAGIGGVKLVFDSAGDINTNVFTIIGKDQDGFSITETVTGVTTTAVSTTKFYSQVTSITPSITTTSNVFVGTVTGELSTPTIPLNRYSDIAAVVGATGVTGTCQFDLQETLDDLRTASGTNVPAWFNIVGGQTVDVSAEASVGATGVRLKFDSYSDGAELQFHALYNPYR